MAFPPFPSQDLAKLVLGYLIEEQLMTAYDEFLHQSPYLDAEKNEFDRIAMQPLRHLLGEYRAVKIYVESCKPVALRRRLFQCPNLLEVVKLLVQYVDVKRIQEDLCRDHVRADSQEPTSRTGCEACLSLKLESCVCSNKRRKVSSTSINNSESVEAGRSTVTNTLPELSGNQNLDNRHVGVTASHTSQTNTISQQEILPGGYPGVDAPNVDQNSIHLQPNPNITTTQPPNVTGNTTALECSQNIAEFNTVLNQVYNKSNVTGGLRDNNSMMSTETTNNNRIPNCQPESFQDFSTGVRGPGASSTNVNVPDSSTTENLTVPLSRPDTEQTISNKRTVKTFQKRSCAFRVGNVKHDVTEITSEVIDVDDDIPSNPTPGEQKVTILSNVKVGNDERLIKMPKHATSTPLLQFQTICLNGTPIFRPKSVEQKLIYTKDEIMAMPTLIIVPASGPSKTAPTVCQPQTMSAQSSSITTSTTSAPPPLKPLTVDVSNSSSNVTGHVPNAHKPQEATVQDTTASQPGLVKTVEALRNASVPKDNTVPGSSTSTPQGLPPMRKSSSTPRRTTSHVRVLDFTTPRRILNEPTSENPNEEAESDKPVEVMISKSPNVSFPRGSIILDNTGQSETTVDADKINETETLEANKSVKKKIVENKKRDWDADLRALVAGSQQPLKQRIFSPSSKSKPKQKIIKKCMIEKENVKNKTIVNTAEKTRKKSSVKSNDSVNNKLQKKKDKPETVERPEENVPSPTVSPLGIIQYARERPACEPEKLKDKSNDEDRIVTPEVERLSLRNEIGGKLNISDILETPYKQALYEIQMETPRFLGPELPDDPMSDIKITDIPTPRFLTANTPFTPKTKQATPSSYSSRPTDYSSGGSYYKPDDQDYLRIVDDTICPVTSTHSKDNSKETVTVSTAEPDLKGNKPRRSNRSRPVRQCTKNVSYYNSPMTTKSTNSNKKDDVSSCSDSASANSSFDNTLKEDVPAPRSERKHTTKSDNKSKPSLSKKRSPLKKVTQKPFMKIKPRNTPTKDSSRKSSRKSSESSQVTLKGKPRMRTSSKVSGNSPHAAAVPTKRRRKSATPRKLHRTEFKSSDHDSAEAVSMEKSKSEIQNSSVSCVQDSDTEQLPLRWSDDGSQESRALGETDRENEDEISKIQEYINKTMDSSHKDNEMSQIKEYIDSTMGSGYKENEGSLQNDLIKRGFDIETAKKIERDLLSTPVPEDNRPNLPFIVDEERSNRTLERPAESESTLPKNVISEEEYLEEDFSVHDCKEGSANYLIVQHDGIARPEIPPEEDPKLKDKFSLEICIDDGDVVRLRASSYNILMDEDFQDLGETIKETEMAVSSISNIDRLYTPMKDHIRAQCYSIFDSTLTSIDTPLKADSPSRTQNTISVTIEEENPEEIPELREKTENRKRKRLRCSSASDESVTDHKRVKPDTHIILTKDLKNMDIEVLLTKLHGSTTN